MLRSFLTAMLVCIAAPALAADSGFPMRIPAPNGEVILAGQREKNSYDEYRYAASRRVDNMLYVSGVVMGRAPDEGNDIPAFKVQLRRGFERLKATLAAAGATFADVVMVNSFHVWQGPNFSGTPDEHWDAFSEVAAEYFSAPHPAWTAVGTSGLLAKTGVVEVQLIVRLPK